MLALVLFLVPSFFQTSVDRTGILNPGFDRILEVGTLGNTTNPVDGAFWIGAEGRTQLDPVSGNRWLELASGKVNEDFVYQRVGCPNGKQDTVKITGNVFVGAGDDARITFAPGVLQHWSIDWVLEGAVKSFFHPGDYDPGSGILHRWQAWKKMGPNPPA